jgi:N-acetyl-gamma-glutamyl-phosphate reductase
MALQAAVAGATGYIGIQAVSLLSRHPEISLVQVSSRSQAGKSYAQAVPGSGVDLEVVPAVDPAAVDVVFACLPHGVAGALVQPWLDDDVVVVDMSADFRLRDEALHREWYGDVPGNGARGRAAYGLVELHRDALKSADILAMPGCYSTAAILATAPALAANLVEPDVIIDAKSGVSGAGRSPSLTTHFGEANETVRAYSVSGHRHKAEMLEQLSQAAGVAVSVTFVPHLVPMTRGILVTAYLHPRKDTNLAEIKATYSEFADMNPFVRLVAEPPSTKSVVATNMAAIHVSEQGGSVVITCAIDNLLKGAAGQGVQACNVRFGFPETAGLEMTGIWP